MYFGDADGWNRMLVALCILAVLGLWKLVEIIVWLLNHVHIGFN